MIARHVSFKLSRMPELYAHSGVFPSTTTRAASDFLKMTSDSILGICEEPTGGMVPRYLPSARRNSTRLPVQLSLILRGRQRMQGMPGEKKISMNKVADTGYTDLQIVHVRYRLLNAGCVWKI
jgi:hypothetical protein